MCAPEWHGRRRHARRALRRRLIRRDERVRALSSGRSATTLDASRTPRLLTLQLRRALASLAVLLTVTPPSTPKPRSPPTRMRPPMGSPMGSSQFTLTRLPTGAQLSDATMHSGLQTTSGHVRKPSPDSVLTDGHIVITLTSRRQRQRTSA